MTTLETLKAAREKIADSKNWCTKDSAIDIHETPTYPESKTAIKWCAIGSIHSINRASQAYFYMVVACDKLYNKLVSDANDTLGHDAIMKAFDLAIEMAEKESE